MATLTQKRRLDTTIGWPVCVILNLFARLLGAILRRDHSLTAPPRRTLVIKLIGLGSITHATLLLRALKEKWPHTRLSFLCFPEVAPLVERLPLVDEMVVLDDSSYWRLLVTVLAFVLRQWRRRPDLVIDLEVHSKFSTILATLTCARDRAGFYVDTSRFRHGLYTHLLYYQRLRHVQEAYRQLGRALGLDPDVGQPVRPNIAAAEQEAVRKLVAPREGWSRRLLVVNVNAGELCLERRWEPAKFARVMAEFAGREDLLIVMIGSPAEAEYTESVRQLVPGELRDRILNTAGQISFGEFLALLEQADVLLTNDTGPLHLAAALGVPTVSLWGPGLPDTYRPLHGEHRVVWKSVYCSPCLFWVSEPVCGGDNVCMKRIEWPEVAAEVADLLGITLPAVPEAAAVAEGSAPQPQPVEGYAVRQSATGRRPAEQESSVSASTRPGPAWAPRRDPLVWAILAVYFALAVTYSYVMELGYGPDETTRHYPYVKWLANQRCLPPADPNVDCGPLELHPPLYYLLLTPVYVAATSFGNRAALRALRWTSPFLILAALLLWLAVIRKACADDRRTTLFAFALTAWWPNLFVDAGALNNDVGAIVASAALLYLICVRQWRSRSWASAVLWGAVVGLGGLIKSSVLTSCVPVIAVALLWQHGKRFYADGRFWIRALLAAAACLALCQWWYLRNLELHGSLVPIPHGYCLIPAGVTKLEALESGLVGELFLRAVNGLWVSVFAGAVWFPDWSHPAVYGALRLLTALGLVGLAVGVYRLIKGRAYFADGQAAAIVIPSVGFAAIYLSAIWVAIFVHAGLYQGGRYLMTFLPGLTIPFALGLKQLFPRRFRTALMVIVAVFFLALNVLVWYHLITYWNPYVLSTSGRFE